MLFYIILFIFLFYCLRSFVSILCYQMSLFCFYIFFMNKFFLMFFFLFTHNHYYVITNISVKDMYFYIFIFKVLHLICPNNFKTYVHSTALLPFISWDALCCGRCFNVCRTYLVKDYVSYLHPIVRTTRLNWFLHNLK